jgi:hypothetical protein
VEEGGQQIDISSSKQRLGAGKCPATPAALLPGNF